MGIYRGVGLLVGMVVLLFGCAVSVSAERYTGGSYVIDASVAGNSFGGTTNGGSYVLTASGGESIVGNGSGGSYILRTGYTPQLPQSLEVVSSASGVVFQYQFDEADGNAVYDSSTNDISTAIVGSLTHVTGKVGMGIQGFSSSNYINTNEQALFDALSNFTACSWIKPATIGTDQYFMSRSDATTSASGMWAFGVNSSGNLVFRMRTSGGLFTTTGSTTLSAGTWYHACVTINTSTLVARQFLNGLSESSVTYTGTTSAPGVPVLLGTRAAGTQPFSGVIDETRILDVVIGSSRSLTEFLAGNDLSNTALLYTNALPGSPTNVTSRVLVRTDAPGYSLHISQNHDLSYSTYTIPPITNGGTIASPATWVNGTTQGLGFTINAVYGGGSFDSKWNSGNKYAAIPNSPTTFYTTTSAMAGGRDKHQIVMRYRLDPPNSAAATPTTLTSTSDLYTNIVTITGVMTP
jgi:hypothetical protein